MTSIARIAANRANSRKSTGPKTAAGKARVSRNARRHGLSRPLFCEGAFTPHAELLARQIAGEDACGERLALARNIAAAQLDLARIRIAKRDLQDAANFGTADDKHPCDWSVLPQLERLDRYEQRVFTRRRRAIREFCKSKPIPAVEDTANSFPVWAGSIPALLRFRSGAGLLRDSAPVRHRLCWRLRLPPHASDGVGAAHRYGADLAISSVEAVDRVDGSPHTFAANWASAVNADLGES